jgi:hypothetical protein
MIRKSGNRFSEKIMLKRREPQSGTERCVLVSDSLCRQFCGDFGAAILRWTRFICINESLTLDSSQKLDSNRLDSERDWGSSEAVQKFSEGA